MRAYSITFARARRSAAGWVVTALVLIGMTFALSRPARGATVEQVNKSITKAIGYLYATQKPDGSWEPTVGHEQFGGNTAMATYALLAAGENPQDPRLAKGIDWLLTKSDGMKGHYAIGMRAQVWPFLPSAHPQRVLIKNAIKRDRDLLLGNYSKDQKSPNYGFYSYFPGNPHFDRSISQYGVLGMWAVERAGGEVSRSYWDMIDKVWSKTQQPDGGWNYVDGQPVRGTMTAAGLATLYIAGDYIGDASSPCNGNVVNTYIDKGLAWMDKQAAGMLNPPGFYGMYGVERIGVASGRKYFGPTPWYAVGSDNIVRTQVANGGWAGQFPGVPDTCFSIYFLTRGRAPVIMNKLEWKPAAATAGAAVPKLNWNQRPRDLANFSKWMGHVLDGRYINWQVVNLQGNVDDLHDSPILYLAGSTAMAFTPQELAKLKQFVDNGGLILGNADCGKDPFAKSFKELSKSIAPKYEFRELPQDHPIYTNQPFNALKWRFKPKVEGLSNGVRELMLLVPELDLGRIWQVQAELTRVEHYQLGADIALYSNGGQNLRYRGATHIVKDAGKAPARKLRIARLKVGGNPDPEPGGWPRLNNIMKNGGLAALSDFDKLVPLGEGQLKGYNVAHLTGTTAFELKANERKELKEFVEGGGKLVIDAAGGSAVFGDSAEVELVAIFGDVAKKGMADFLPQTHALFAQPPITAFNYRAYTRLRMAGRPKTSRIKGFEVNGKPLVFFSREDLSAGLVGQSVDGIVGYEPDVAAAIMRNILLLGAS